MPTAHLEPYLSPPRPSQLREPSPLVPPLQMERGRKIEELAEADRKYVSDAYKREVVEAMSTSQV